MLQQLSYHQPVFGVYGQDGSFINANSPATGGSPSSTASFAASPQQLSRNNSFPLPQGGHRPLSGNPLPPTSSSPPLTGAQQVEEPHHPHVHKGLLFVSYRRGGNGQRSEGRGEEDDNDDDNGGDEYEFDNCGGSKKKKKKKRTKSEGDFSQDRRSDAYTNRLSPRPASSAAALYPPPSSAVPPLSGVHEYTAFSGERVRNSLTSNNASYDGRVVVSSVGGGGFGASHNQNTLVVGPSGVLPTTHKGVVVVARYAQQQRGGAATAAPPPTPSSSNPHLQATVAGSYWNGNAFPQQRSNLPPPQHMSAHMNMMMGPPNSQWIPPSQTTPTCFAPPASFPPSLTHPPHPQGHLHPLPSTLPLPLPFPTHPLLPQLQPKVSDPFAFNYDEAEASLLGDPATALSCYCSKANTQAQVGHSVRSSINKPQTSPPLTTPPQQQLSVFAVLFVNNESMTITNYIFSEHLKQRKATVRGEEHERRSIEMAFFVVARDIIAKEERQRMALEAEGVEERRAEENEALIARRVEAELARRGLMNVISFGAGNVVTVSSSSEKDVHPNSSEEATQKSQQQETPNSPNTSGILTSSGDSGGGDDGNTGEETLSTAGRGFSSSSPSSASPSPPPANHWPLPLETQPQQTVPKFVVCDGHADNKVLSAALDTGNSATCGESEEAKVPEEHVSRHVTSTQPQSPSPAAPPSVEGPRGGDSDSCDGSTLKKKKKKGGGGFLCFGKQSSTKEAKE